MRTILKLSLEDIDIVGTIDHGNARTGLLIVSGGTQTRIGPHRGMAALAQAVAARGFPVFRFDRRGVGDSGGDDPGFRGSGPDIAAAAEALRAHCPQVTHVAGFGLCDGASALALHHRAAAIDSLILANPWVVEPQSGLPPAAAIRRRYLHRLTSREGWARLLSGAIDLRKAARGLRAAAAAGDGSLAAEIGGALGRSPIPAHILLSAGDATAIAFAAEYRAAAFALARQSGRMTLTERATGSHSFAPGADRRWLAETVIGVLEAIARP